MTLMIKRKLKKDKKERIDYKKNNSVQDSSFLYLVAYLFVDYEKKNEKKQCYEKDLTMGDTLHVCMCVWATSEWVFICLGRVYVWLCMHFFLTCNIEREGESLTWINLSSIGQEFDSRLGGVPSCYNLQLFFRGKKDKKAVAVIEIFWFHFCLFLFIFVLWWKIKCTDHSRFTSEWWFLVCNTIPWGRTAVSGIFHDSLCKTNTQIHKTLVMYLSLGDQIECRHTQDCLLWHWRPNKGQNFTFFFSPQGEYFRLKSANNKSTGGRNMALLAIWHLHTDG